MKKSRIIAVILCTIIAGVSISTPVMPNLPVTASTIAELERQKRENNAAIAEYENQLKEIENSAADRERYQEILLEKIGAQEEKLNIIRDQLTELESELDAAEGEINRLNVEISAEELELEKNFEYFKTRLRAMYIAGNDSVVSVLSGSTDFYDMLSKMELVTRIAKSDTELLDKIKSQLDELNEQKAIADEKKADLSITYEKLDEIMEEFTVNYESLVRDNEKTNSEIERLKTEKDKTESSIEDTKKEQIKIDAEIKKLNEEIRRRQEELRKKNNKSNYTYKGEKFLWPVPSSSYISSGYGYRWGSLHGGIDIAGGNVMGAGVVASASGIVILASKTCSHNYGKSYNCGCGMSYGNYIVIDHGDDKNGTSYVTLYGHLTDVNVVYGQEVKAGDYIGTVGSTGFSTGPHLHFEIRVNNVRKNPLSFFSKYYK